MSDLGVAAREYLSVRRSVGFKLVQAERLLSDFVCFAESEAATHVTVDLAVRWATRPAGASSAWWRSRLCVVRGFARHLSAVDPATEVPPLDLLPRVPAATTRATPYLYSAGQITALMDAAESTRFDFTAVLCRTLIGLLAVTGMRVGEALRLDDPDLDWSREVLIIRDSKFDRSRQVPLHPSTVAALRDYLDQRDRRHRRPASPAVFVSWRGGRLSYGGIRWHFERLAHKAGVEPVSPHCRPRLHDFRH
jgi:integrase